MTKCSDTCDWPVTHDSGLCDHHEFDRLRAALESLRAELRVAARLRGDLIRDAAKDRAALGTAERLLRTAGDDWGGLDDSSERRWYADVESYLRGDHRKGADDA